MNGLYQAVDKIRGIINDTALVNTVFNGRGDEFLQKEKNFYPAALINYGNSTITNEATTVTMSIVILDQVDEDFGNEEDVLNQTLVIAQRIVAVLQEATPDSDFSLDDPVPADPLYETDVANLSGWGLEIPLKIHNRSHNNNN